MSMVIQVIGAICCGIVMLVAVALLPLSFSDTMAMRPLVTSN